MSGEHVAASLYRDLGPDAFSVVGSWLRNVCSEHALELVDPPQVISPSVAWLAEAVTMFDPSSGGGF